MNKYLFGFSVLLLLLVIIISNIAINQYRGKIKAQKQVISEQEAVYKMEQIKYQYELELKRLNEILEQSGLCEIKLETNL